MPLSGSDVASKPAGTTFVAGTVIESVKMNSVIDDIYSILNTTRTIAKGFTGASSAQGALDNFFTGTTFVEDANLRIADPADNTKLGRFDVGGVTTGTTRVYTLPDADITVAGINLAQTWTATQTFANLTATGTVVIGDGSGDSVTIKGTVLSAFMAGVLDDADAAALRSSAGLGTSATVNTGTSGATIPLLDGANTWSAAQTYSGQILAANGTVSAPGLSFSADTGEGFYRPLGTQLSLAIGGVEQASWHSTNGYTQEVGSIKLDTGNAGGIITGSSHGIYQLSSSTVTLATGAAGNIHLRPNGSASTTGQMSIASTGAVTINGTLTVTG